LRPCCHLVVTTSLTTQKFLLHFDGRNIFSPSSHHFQLIFVNFANRMIAVKSYNRHSAPRIAASTWWCSSRPFYEWWTEIARQLTRGVRPSG